jgi:hypothetical protein
MMIGSAAFVLLTALATTAASLSVQARMQHHQRKGSSAVVPPCSKGGASVVLPPFKSRKASALQHHSSPSSRIAASAASWWQVLSSGTLYMFGSSGRFTSSRWYGSSSGRHNSGGSEGTRCEACQTTADVGWMDTRGADVLKVRQQKCKHV